MRRFIHHILFYAVLVLTIGLPGLIQELFAFDRAGVRGLQIRSQTIVTVWLGYRSTNDMDILKQTARYTFSSRNDAAYQRGVHPVRVARFAKGSYSSGWDGEDSMDNFMHCYLPYPLQPGKSYTVSLASGLVPVEFETEFTFRYDQTPNPGYKLNQVGYSERVGTKLVYFSSYLGDGVPVDVSEIEQFEVRRAADHQTVMTGSVQWVSDHDAQGGDTLYKLNISELQAKGAFYIWMDGIGRSYTFLNNANAAQEIYGTIAKGLYFQRCGAFLSQEYAGVWARPAAHDEIYVTEKNIVHPWLKGHGDGVIDPHNPNAGDWYVPDGPRPFHGGHYDAGDFDLRLTHVGVGERLMSLYEACPERFYDGQISIPENENGIPDILDQAAWSLKQWEYCQDYAQQVRGLNGGVAPGMESYTFAPVVPGTGDQDPLPYWMRKVTPYSSFAAAGLFAQASRVFLHFDTQRANRYLQRARDAYYYAVHHSHERWDPVLPWIDGEEAYTAALLSDAWCWAAGQLFATTGANSYWQDFEANYDGNSGYVFWNFDRWIVHWPVIFSERSGDYTVQTYLRERLIQRADEIVKEIEENARNGYRAACPNEGTFGSASPLHSGNIGPVIRAYLLTKERKYLNAVAGCIDFVLGMNPSEMSWMTGAGSVYPVDPLNINCKYDNVQDPYPVLSFTAPPATGMIRIICSIRTRPGWGFTGELLIFIHLWKGASMLWTSRLPGCIWRPVCCCPSTIKTVIPAKMSRRLSFISRFPIHSMTSFIYRFL
ncbi:MAG: glycoside hydrolase family 9 protein [candidate division KSB1 bacterium]|nr:glycoside hydrolase family 9 protein [candidate division KSB1 bacterium]